MIRIFPSINFGNEIAYQATDKTMSMFDMVCQCRGHYVARFATEYQTYGHGTCQHGPEYLIPRDHFADFCISIAVAAVDDPELMEILGKEFPFMMEGQGRERTRFLANIKYDPDKPRWYSWAEEKITASKTKQHDKRWTEVPSWADGSIDALYSLHGFGPISLLEQYDNYEMIRQVRREREEYMGNDPATWLKLDGNAGNAFDAASYLMKSYRYRKFAQQTVDSYNRHRQWEAEEKAAIESDATVA